MYVKLVIVAGVVGDEAVETKMEPTVQGYRRHHSENKIREQALDFIFSRGADCQV